MPRQLNLVIIGVSLFRPYAISAVQISQHPHRGGTSAGTAGAAHGHGHLVVLNSWGEVDPIDLVHNAGLIAEWCEATATVAVGPFSLLPEVDPGALWSTATVSESDARSAIADSSRASDAELIRRCGRLSYSSGRAHFTWADAVTGTKACQWSQAIAAGAAAWWGREVIRRGSQARRKAKKPDQRETCSRR